MKVLIDGDSLVYTIGFACQKNIWQAVDTENEIVYYENETKTLVLGFIEDHPELGALDLSYRIEVSPVAHAYHSIKMIIQKIAQRAKANSYKVYLTGGGNFREQIATILGYKHNRKDKPKPILYQEIRDYLVNVHKATIVNGMEADDALSIVYTKSVHGDPVNVSLDPNHEVLKYPEECIIAAIDKDLRNIPGKHINFDKRVAENNEYKFLVVSEEEGRHTFWKQCLTGDSSDNILGIPQMGPKKADALLDPLRGKTEEEYFWAVYGAYKKYYGEKPFQYYRYDAYTDTTATFRKRELKPEDQITPEQRLTGTALTLLLENARLLWMLRVPPNAEGTHWWMPPISFEDIEFYDDYESWLNKDKKEPKKEPAPDPEPKEEKPKKETKPEEPLKKVEDYEDKEINEPWSEGRGKWYVIVEQKGVKLLIGPVGTKKKAQTAVKEFYEKLERVDRLTSVEDPEPKPEAEEEKEEPKKVTAPYWDESFDED